MKSLTDTLAGLAVCAALLATPAALAAAADGTWIDLGSGLDGIVGIPVLTATGTLEGGTEIDLILTNGAPSAPGMVVVGYERIDLPFHGGLLVPSPDFLFTHKVITDEAGALTLVGRWPVGVAGGVPYFFQVWLLDPAGLLGWSASNALAGTTP